jgi:hypothetical protein
VIVEVIEEADDLIVSDELGCVLAHLSTSGSGTTAVPGKAREMVHR